MKPQIQTQPYVRSLYSPRHNEILDCSHDEPLTEQTHLADCDINTIVKRNLEQGWIPPINQNPALYGDFASELSYMDSLNIVVRAEEQFEALPANVRDRFANSPERFLAFCEDPSNLDEMVKLGLATKRVASQISSETPLASPTLDETAKNLTSGTKEQPSKKVVP